MTLQLPEAAPGVGASRHLIHLLLLLPLGMPLVAAEPTTLGTVVVEEEVEEGYLSETATAGGKTPESRREIPLSVSVLTREQMDQQNMVTTWDALQQMPGVTAVSNDITQSQFHSRGMALDVQFDGVPSSMPLSGNQQFDLAIYDRIEVQRGPAGLTQGAGAFGGSVNLVRKRALSERRASLMGSAGSWNNFRAEMDYSTPLNAAGTLRGRAVASFIDRDYVYDRVHDRKRLGYLTVGYDLTPATTVNAFFSWQDDVGSGFSGLPTYTNGQFLDVPRSFNTAADWSRGYWKTRDVDLELQHVVSDDWKLTLKAGRRDQNQMFHDGYTSTGVNPQTGTANYARREFYYDHQRDGLDAFVAGVLPLFGRRHDVLVGFNHSYYRRIGHGVGPTQQPSLTVTQVPIASPPAVPEPQFVHRAGTDDVTREHGYYARVRANLADSLSVYLGGRRSHFGSRARNMAPATPTNWRREMHASGEFTPFAGITWSLRDNWNVYGSYADIYDPQTARRVTGEVLDPYIGRQLEVGTKADLAGELLHVAVAAFNIREKNNPYADPDNPGFFLPYGLVESEGAEIEIVGRPRRGWDISAGYTWLDTRYVRHRTLQGMPLSGWYPRHALKFWGTHVFAGGVLDGLRLGAGVRAQTRTISGASTASATLSPRRQGGYAVVSAQAAYAVTAQLSVSLQAENLFNTHYFTRLGGLNSYNAVAEPRSGNLSVRWSF